MSYTHDYNDIKATTNVIKEIQNRVKKQYEMLSAKTYKQSSVSIQTQNNDSSDPMECPCGYDGKTESRFIKTNFVLVGNDNQPLGPMFICPKCGGGRFSKVAMVQHVLDKGSV